MNVLIINLILHTAEKGVIPRYHSNSDCMIYNMARGFVASGHKVTILASEEFRPLEPENNPFDIIYFPSVLPKLFRPDLLPLPKGLMKWLRNHHEEYEKVITSETFSFGTLAAARVCPGKTVIWQEMASLQKAFKKIPSRFWYNVVAPLTMSQIPVIARSETARKFILKYMRNVSERIVDHGIDGDIFHPSLGPKKKSFIVISRLVRGKRIDLTIEKFARFIAIPGYEDYHLDIVGDGDERENLEQLTEQLGIGKNVTFHGRLPHSGFSSLSADSMAFLVNTQNDLNMVSIPESIVSGTPIVTNTVPTCIPFLIKEGVGIAKDNWDEKDLLYVVQHNSEFVENCKRVRPSLLNTGCAQSLIKD